MDPTGQLEAFACLFRAIAHVAIANPSRKAAAGRLERAEMAQDSRLSQELQALAQATQLTAWTRRQA